MRIFFRVLNRFCMGGLYVLLAIMSMLFFAHNVCADVYKVDNFRGGMNLADSSDLDNNTLLSVKNMVINGDELVSRFGWGQWNDSTIVPAGAVNNCFVYQPNSSTYRMIISCGNFIYKVNNLDGPSSIDWPAAALMYTDAGTVSADTLFITDNFWSRLSVAYGDSVFLSCSPDSAFSVIFNFPESPGPNDTTILLNKSTPFTDSTGVIFEIWRWWHGPSFNQYKDKLYIADSLAGPYAGGFPMVYNDTTYNFLGVIDTGVVDDSSALSDTPSVVSDDKYAYIDDNSNIVTGQRIIASGNDSLSFPDWSDVTTGMIFKTIRPAMAGDDWRFDSVIDSIYADSVQIGNYTHTRWYLRLQDIKITAFFGSYEIRSELYPCGFAGFSMRDSSKNFLDIAHDIGFLNTFYLQSANDDTVFNIYCNTDDDILADGVVDIGDRYYIYSMLPYQLGVTSDDFQQFPYIYQIMFHEERLWGSGNQYSRYYITQDMWWNRRGDVNTVWYSDPAYPEYIRYTHNQSIGNNEKLTGIFELLGERYFASANAIWHHKGIPASPGVRGSIRTEKVANTGFTDKKSWTLAANNVGYFANDAGIWKFNGGTAFKISRSDDFNIEAFHDKYKNGRIVMGHKDDVLYVSYPDSRVTLRYDERKNFWSWFSFGMSFIMTEWADIDTNIFLFGNPDHPGLVFYYPTTVYFDSLAQASAAYEWEILSGNQSYGAFEYRKSIVEVNLSVQSQGSVFGYLYRNFSDSYCDSMAFDSMGNYIYNEPSDRSCWGEYFQHKFSGTSGNRVVVRGYKVVYKWQEKRYSP